MIDGKGLFYNGLLKSLLKHCKERGLSIKVEDIKRYMPDNIEDTVIDNLTSYIKFPLCVLFINTFRLSFILQFL